MTTYGEYADRVRNAMAAMGLDADNTDAVRALVRMALPARASDLDAWAVAAIIVPDCTKLGDPPASA
jgi:hypothetical protein